MNPERWASVRYVVTVILSLALATVPAALADTQEHTAHLPLLLGPSPELTPAVCVRVVDGDTIELQNGSHVRYILADTREVYHGVECYGPEATERNKELVEGRAIGLQVDRSECDRYDRLLRYVWVDGQDVGAVLIREGYARVAIYQDTKHLSWYLNLQDQALAESAGMWGACDYPTPTPYP